MGFQPSEGFLRKNATKSFAFWIKSLFQRVGFWLTRPADWDYNSTEKGKILKKGRRKTCLTSETKSLRSYW